MHQAVRLYQFKYWFADTTCLAFGKLRQVEREAPGSLTWTSLAHLKSDHTVQKELLEKEASVEADDDDVCWIVGGLAR